MALLGDFLMFGYSEDAWVAAITFAPVLLFFCLGFVYFFLRIIQVSRELKTYERSHTYPKPKQEQ